MKNKQNNTNTRTVEIKKEKKTTQSRREAKVVKDKTLLVGDFGNSVERVVNYYLLNEYVSLSKKLWKSKAIFIFLSLSSMVMSTIVVILTMFVIGKDLGGHKMFFICISIITAFIGFITGIEGIFKFKRRKEIYATRIEELKSILGYIDRRVEQRRPTDRIVLRVSEKLADLEHEEI